MPDFLIDSQILHSHKQTTTEKVYLTCKNTNGKHNDSMGNINKVRPQHLGRLALGIMVAFAKTKCECVPISLQY